MASNYTTALSAVLLAIAGYLGVTVPATTTTITGIIILIVVAVLQHVNVTNTEAALATATAAASPASTQTAPTAPASASVTALGCTVLPAFQPAVGMGKSPFAAAITIQASTDVVGYTVNWNDGSPAQTGALAVQGAYAVATLSHTYTFTITDPHYTGHLYQPTITVYNNAGVSLTLPAAACNINVTA